MRFLHLLTIALLTVAATLAPARAATTYAWPLTVNLPVNITLGPGGPIAGVAITCTYTRQSGTNAGRAMVAGVTPAHVTMATTGSVGQQTYSYSGTLKLSVTGGADAGSPPATGDVITCKLTYNQPHGANWTYSGPVSLTLP
jgi:hypothetical protein